MKIQKEEIVWLYGRTTKRITKPKNESMNYCLDSLKSEVKWALENTANDNASGIDNIPVCQIHLNLTRWCNQRVSCTL